MSPAFRAFAARFAAGMLSPTCTVDAAVFQVERVGVPLRSVADDGDLLRLDQGEVRVLVAENSSAMVFCFSLTSRE